MAQTSCKNWPRTAASLLNVFLTPSPALRCIGHLRGPSPRCFSTSQSLQYPRKTKSNPAKRKRDNNMMRGMSALKGTGIHKNMRLSVGIEDIPEPVAKEKITPEQGDENHGLWGFFNKDRTALTPPEDLGKHGRAWSRQELRRKSWEDLHSLWWVCLKERNQLKTEDVERERLEAGYGNYESKERVKVIQETMKQIKSVLKERWYNWEDARRLAMEDPEIQVMEDGQVKYTPTLNQYDYDYDEVFEEEEAAASPKPESEEASPFAEEPMPSQEELRRERQEQPTPSEKPSSPGLEPIIPEGRKVGEITRRW